MYIFREGAGQWDGRFRTCVYGLIFTASGAVLWGAGTLGGLLPDIDADASTPLNWIFSLLAVIAALFTVRLVAGQSLVMIWGAMLCVFWRFDLAFKRCLPELRDIGAPGTPVWQAFSAG